MSTKIPWDGTLTSVQPRIRLTRSFDERSHSYLGYLLTVDGTVGGEKRSSMVGVGKAAQAKHELRVGDYVSGESERVSNPDLEVAEYYKTAKLKVVVRAPAKEPSPPPWHGPPPALEVYRERGHRRLAARTYDSKCSSCMWGCLMPVEMIVDHWNPGKRRYRTETWCYGPLSCRFYAAGPKRKVPGRKGMSYTEEDWVDEEETRHREPDE